jgi:hypothetical protein
MTTLLDIKAHVKDDLDLNDQSYVEDTDITRWANEGIAVAESQIHTLYEDYFLVETDPVQISTGQSLVDYPSDIYANKIRKIIFTDGLGNSNTSHVVNRVKNLIHAKEKDLYGSDTSTPTLTYIPYNPSGTGRKIRLFPESGRGGYLHVFYIRNANRLVNDTDILDIDEFERFIVQYVKTQSYLKDGDPRAEDSKILEEQFKADMVMTLSTMVPDDDNALEMDMDSYNEQVGDFYPEDC